MSYVLQDGSKRTDKVLVRCHFQLDHLSQRKYENVKKKKKLLKKSIIWKIYIDALQLLRWQKNSPKLFWYQGHVSIDGVIASVCDALPEMNVDFFAQTFTKYLQIFQLNSQICTIWRQLNDGLVWCECVICLSSRARPQPGCHWPQTNYWQKQYCVATAALHQQLDQVWHSSHINGIVPKGHASLWKMLINTFTPAFKGLSY